MQIKTTVKHHLISIKMTNVKKKKRERKKITTVSEDTEKLNPFALLVGL